MRETWKVAEGMQSVTGPRRGVFRARNGPPKPLARQKIATIRETSMPSFIDRLCEYLNGRTEAVNWDDSWLIETVNEAEWSALRDSVRKSYDGVLHCLAEIEDWNEMRVGMAMGLLAHTAYHLGAIRQIAKAI